MAGESVPEAELPLAEVLDVMREGFAVCEMLRDESGGVVDYRILQANAAYLKGLGGKSALRRTLRTLRPDVSDDWYRLWDELLAAGKRTRFEYFDPAVRRWYDVRLTPMGADRVVQLYIDVTQRKQMEADQAALFNELNHRVKNNLMTVSGFLSMQARTTRHPEVKQELALAIGRIEAISEVHAILYRTGAVETVDVPLYVAELCQRLAKAISGGRVAIAHRAEAATVSSDQALQLGIVLNELITNAVKHAYPQGAQGRIEVEVAAPGERIEIVVRDFGPGLPEGKPPSPGLGMRLIRSMTERRGGAFSLETDGGLVVRTALALRDRKR